MGTADCVLLADKSIIALLAAFGFAPWHVLHGCKTILSLLFSI
jgi:hypothetical protein